MNSKTGKNFLSTHRRGLLMLLDMVSVTLLYLLTWMLISGRATFAEYRSQIVSSTALFTMCFVIVFGLMGMYDSIWRYAEVYEFFRCALASLIAVMLFVAFTLFIYTDRRIPLSVYLLSALFAVSVTLYTRLTYRMIRNRDIKREGSQRRRVMVVGAGEAASTLIHEVFRDPNTDYNIVCAVDDDPDKVGRTIMGIRIMGGSDNIPDLVKKCDVDTIIVAIPAADEKDKRRILNICSKTSCNMRMLPDICKLISDGKDIMARVREVKVEDLLGREEIDLDAAKSPHVKGKTVMVTGGGGSIGSELCRQIAASEPKKLIVVDIYENSAYELQQNLIRKYGESLDLDVRIMSVRDADKVDSIISETRPDIIFHAAAHKHVPLMEVSPEEAVKNNVFGTLNVARAADKYGVKRMVLISTDKAVNPTSIMGATKRLCEMVIQTMNSISTETSYVAVRFGNVLGSNGSVIPLFKEQIANGGPVTVTHPDIVRYFMTIPEAVRLVITASELAKGGEIFVLDMGEQVKILDLAENLIRLAGFLPYKDIPIIFTGLRPGEKLYEELLMSEEGLQSTENAKIFIGNPGTFDTENFFERLEELRAVAHTNDSKRTVRKVIEMVPTFIEHPDTGE